MFIQIITVHNSVHYKSIFDDFYFFLQQREFLKHIKAFIDQKSLEEDFLNSTEIIKTFS